MSREEIVEEIRRLMKHQEMSDLQTIGPYTLTLQRFEILALLHQIGLALTHPVNHGRDRPFVAKWERRMRDRLLGPISDPIRTKTFWITAIDTLVLLMELQLVLTHPRNRVHHAWQQWTHKFAHRIQKYLAVNPTIIRICQLGWIARGYIAEGWRQA